MAWAMSELILQGAREHNLQSVDLALPHGRWIGVVGPSGSGKTSLVFQTLLREGQRRYLGALSARARHFLGKLGRADVDQLKGLQAPIAVGEKVLSANPRSTVGTLTGALDLLRLLFARLGVDPQGVPLSRSHFSFNTPEGACPACDGVGVEDQVAPELLVADPSKSIREGALRPTLKNGYTVYSQVTLEVMNRICGAHGFDVDTPWRALSPAQHRVIFYGTQALKVPFGKHSIESRMKWSGITARPREEGYYRGLIPVIEETLRRDRNPNILRFVRSVPCSECAGSRLARPGRQARVGEWTLPRLLDLPVQELVDAVRTLPSSPVVEAIVPSLQGRLQRLLRLGLGHLSLARRSTTLSGGEGQRVRLVAQLSAGLGGQLIALDEPTLGLHPQSQAGMAGVLRELRDLGNTLLVVEHDPDMVRHAEHLVRLGPGAGPEGGRVLESGTLTSDAEPLGTAPPPKAKPRVGKGILWLKGASLHTLNSVDLDLRLGAFNVVQGPSGAGKSSLVFGTLLPALMGEAGGPFDGLEGRPRDLKVLAIDAKPIGRSSRSTPATWTGLFEKIRKRFAATDLAKAQSLSASRFSFNSKPGKDGAGRCPACEGLGVVRIGLHLLQDVERPCGVCGGDRYGPQIQGVSLRGLNVGQVLQLSVDQALAHFAEDPEIAGPLHAMADLGLGYLRLGQSSATLSRGEGQRIKLAKRIAEAGTTRRGGQALVLMDEPDRGLHPSDVGRLLQAIEALIESGDTVLAISHHRHLWGAADHRVCLRDGARVPPQDWAPPEPPPPAAPAGLPTHMHLRGVRTHTLKDLDLRIPHRALSVVVGPSGSGKSSLVFGTLAAECSRRFAESLPFQIRRFMRRLPRPELDGAAGLTPVVVLAQGQARAAKRSTVATQSGLGPTLRLLWSRLGRVEGRATELSAGHFSPDQAQGACPACEGLGSVPRCVPERLILRPDKALGAGAMAGTKPGAFFGEPEGQYMATLAAVAPEVDWSQPWSSLSAQAQDLALYGAGERRVQVSWSFSRGQRSGTHHFEGTWDGLCHLVEHEAKLRAHRKAGPAWAAPLEERPCEDCQGARLTPRARAVQVAGMTLPQALALPLGALGEALEGVVLGSLTREIQDSLAALKALDLGHLSLDRGSRSLSEGELQRLRLASVLRSELTGLTVVLDEPSAGLDAQGLRGLVGSLRALVDQGNSVVVVSHRSALIQGADHLIEMGPGAGSEGGEILEQGPAAQVLAGDGPTARALRGAHSLRPIPAGAEGVRILGARFGPPAITLPSSGLVVLTGPSGSGKSRFLFEVLGASAEAGRPVNCSLADGLEGRRVFSGGGSLTSVVDALNLIKPLQQLFAEPGAQAGVPKKAFSFRSPAGRCPSCKGSGIEAVAMDFLADLDLPCPACSGRRYRPEVLAVQWQGMGVDAVLATPAQALRERLPPGPLRTGVDALCQLGLGHLSLGRSGRSLSGGEAQRLRFAAHILGGKGPALHLLDGPGRGLHHSDLLRLLEVFRARAADGDLVVITSARRPLLEAGQVHRFG